MASGGLRADDSHHHHRPGRLEGKRVIFTGAVDNIGKEAVRLFPAEGANVVIGDVNERQRRPKPATGRGHVRRRSARTRRP